MILTIVCFVMLFLLIAFGLQDILDKLEDLSKRLERIESSLKSPSAERIEFYIEIDGKTERMTEMSDLKVNKKAKLSIRIKDKFGNDAAVDGKPEWSLTDPALGNLTVADDGMSAMFEPAGPVGSLQVHASADADLGEGVKTISGQGDINLIAGDAEVIEMAFEEASE